MRRKAGALLALIVLAAALSAAFVFPKALGNRILPWRLGLDLVGGSHLVYEVDMAGVKELDRSSVMVGLRDVIEKRVNLFGVSEPDVVTARSGESYRLIVELAGVKDIAAAIKQIGETPFLLFAEVTDEAALEATTTEDFLSAFNPTELTGRYIVGASLTFDQVTGRSQVSLEFSSDGAKLFEALTEKNVGKPIAVFLDGVIVTAPVVQEKISGGRAQITGNFTTAEAKALVARFNAGALPAPITLISQQTVGATLGVNSLQQTIVAGLIGTVAVALFMVAYYHLFGLFASLALIIYIVFTLALFKLFGITMTLSGIAGFILTIGMAVDANILIFERTREELKRGLSRAGAIEEGFRRAWLSIRDSNISTILTGVILYYFTSGFIKGFALSLIVGVLVSMFSAITVTRTMLRAFSKQ
jgi:preprotein translocase subunit SecD